MPLSIDLSTMSPKARTAYINLGRRFGSDDTLAQANQTLKGLSKHAPALVEHGFADEDTQRLSGARDGLIDAGIGRDDARGDKKVTASAYLAAVERGKDLRKSARAILQGARRPLHEKGDAASEAAVTRIDAALQQTRSLDDDDKLAGQLDVIRNALTDASIAPSVANRGGPKAVTELDATAAEIRATDGARAGSHGTPAETEMLDLLDGIIVTLARDALRAARAAAKRLGTPAMVADFELTKLYPNRHAQGAPATPPAPINTPATP